MSLVCFCLQYSRFTFWFFPYVEHDAKSIPLVGWQFVQVTLHQHVFHVLLNWPFMYHGKLRPLFLPNTVLLGLTDKFVFSRCLSFTFSLLNLPVRFPFCPKFGNFHSGYSIVYLNCCGLCRPVMLECSHGPAALSHSASVYSCPISCPYRVTNVYG